MNLAAAARKMKEATKFLVEVPERITYTVFLSPGLLYIQSPFHHSIWKLLLFSEVFFF